jgi:glycosyltransferase involved in cell wall biosynthesis
MKDFSSGLKKVVLISFYFFPCTLTPSQRISYWAKHLHKLGFYPIVITREWSENIQSHFDTKRPIGDQVRHEKHANYEVYYLPFQPGILDKAYLRWGETAMRPLFLMTKLLDVILANFTLKFTSYSGFFPFLKQLRRKENFSKLIISGEPFYLFKVGYQAFHLLNLHWIADYRDDWSTNELQRQKGGGFLRKIIFKIEAHYERRWVSTADHIISVSKPYTKRIADFLKLEGLTIENGFEENILELEQPPLFEEFTLVYSGTIYPSQNIKVILEALKICINEKRPFRLVFLGSGFDIKEKKRIASLVETDLQPYVEVTERLPRDEALNYLQKSHAVLGISYGSLKGIPSSKLYEYIGLKKPVLLVPTDNDLMEGILKEVGLGFFSEDAKACVMEIDRIRSLYDNGEITLFSKAAEKKVHKYSRFNQMSKISTLLT